MKKEELSQIQEAVKLQFYIPELDILRNEIAACANISAYHACITITNLLLERYCKLVLIYKSTGFKTIQNLKDIEQEFRPGMKKYNSMSLGETLTECKNENVINEKTYLILNEFKLRCRDGFSHADTANILRGQKGHFALGKFDGNEPLETKQLVIQNVPPLHGIAVLEFAKLNAFGYFISVENFIRSTLRTYITDTFEIDFKMIDPL